LRRNTFVNLFNELNSSTFAGVLSYPRILNTRTNRDYAFYEGILTDFGYVSNIFFSMRTIKGLKLAKDLVYHEMVHQYVQEILNIEEEVHHGPEFWKVYRRFRPEGVKLGVRF